MQRCTTILIGIMSTELTESVPNLSEKRFDYKRKDEDDMAKSTKLMKKKKIKKKKEKKTKKLIAQRKELEKRKKAEESKKNEPTGSVRLAVRWNRFLAVRLRRKIYQS